MKLKMPSGKKPVISYQPGQMQPVSNEKIKLAA